MQLFNMKPKITHGVKTTRGNLSVTHKFFKNNNLAMGAFSVNYARIVIGQISIFLTLIATVPKVQE